MHRAGKGLAESSCRDGGGQRRQPGERVQGVRPSAVGQRYAVFPYEAGQFGLECSKDQIGVPVEAVEGQLADPDAYFAG